MKLIYDSASYSTHRDQTDHFGDMYTKGFPDENEREDFNLIIQRVIGDKGPYEPHSIIALSSDETTSEVRGGLIADWYANSKCIHLTYLIIDDSSREKGIGKKLINEGIVQIKNLIQATAGIEIKNVFFESNNPEKTIHDNFNSVTRLEIFSRLGAKWIDIPYIQPALDAAKKEVDNLFLLSFTQFNVKGDRIAEVEITAFLKDLYQSLGASDKNASFIGMQRQLEKQKNEAGDIVLKHIPESSTFHFHKASVTWHLIQTNNSRSETTESNHISSFEKDLLNFQNQKKALFRSVWKGPQLEATIIFPEVYHYTSEGYIHTKTTPANRIELSVILSISSTQLANSDKTIWHITAAPPVNSYFSECDLIKLTTLFGSSQEDSTVKDEIKLTIQEKQITGINPMAVIGRLGFIDSNLQLENSGVGIVQIETFQLDTIHPIRMQDFFTTYQNKEITAIQDDAIKQFSKALCGIILGIFDFNRMDDEEIFDTIQSIVVTDSSFIVPCRGMLFKISERDEIMNSVSNDIIVSPYLLIPNMVLAYNEHILTEAQKAIDQSLNPLHSHNLNELECCQSTVRNVLSFKYLGDIFQYASEKAIIEYGNEQRGINHLYENISKRLQDLSELIEIKKENRSNLSDAFLNAFLCFIAMIQINGLFANLSVFKHHSYIFYLSEVFVSAAIFLLIRAKKIKLFTKKQRLNTND